MARLRFHHVGIACADLPAALTFLELAMDVASRSEVVHDTAQDADVCLLTLADGSRLELVSGPVVEKLVRKGMSYYHVCYEVDDLEDSLAWLRERSCRVVSGPTPAPLFEGRRVAFLFSPVGLVELLEAA